MGWENLFHCEINEWCQKVLRFHFPKSIQYDDITRTDFTPWRGKVDVLTGGFPCQPFSTAGKRRGANSKQQGLPEAAYKKMLPTPTARSYKNGSKITDGRSRRKISQGWTMELNDLAVSGLLPTPTMRDYQPSVSPTGLVRKNGKRRDDALCNIPVMIGQHCQQNDGKTSQLNPLFVEDMMGYPLMWTTLPFLSQNGDKNP